MTSFSLETANLGRMFGLSAKVWVCLCLLFSYFINASVNPSHASAQGFHLTFENFTPKQINQVMVFATRFKAYEQYEVLSQHQLATQIDYQSDITGALLNYNFEQTFAELKWEVVSQQQGNAYLFSFVQIEPEPIPYQVW
ncbi:hypothetical protein PN836_001830 [Ningiella sp. W23]|uniref:hypothetical protein n=1 Tax=Ningiella sp. W23 TaxID=3023715 RepID=UPI003756BCED